MEIDSEQAFFLLKRKTVKGVFYLSLKKALVQMILTTGNIILARILIPEMFGTFAIINYFIAFALSFVDFGFATTIIQARNKPQQKYRQTFAGVLLIDSIVLIALLYITAPFLTYLYQGQLQGAGTQLIRIYALSIIPYSLKIFCHAFFTRQLNYQKIFYIDVLELLSIQVMTVFLAVKGFGVWSFVYGAILGRSVGGVVSILLTDNLCLPKVSFSTLKKMLPFAANYQISQIINNLSGAMLPVFIGVVSGTEAVGLLSWAGGFASLPKALADVFNQIFVPLGARVQHKPLYFKLIFEKLIRLVTFISFIFFAVLLALAPQITRIIYTEKWLPGLTAYYLFSIYCLFSLISDPLMQALVALGKVEIVRNINLFWVIFQWILGVILVFKLGFLGMPLAWALVSLTFFIPYLKLKEFIKIEVMTNVFYNFLLAAASGIIVFQLARIYQINNLLELIGALSVGFIIYTLLVLIFRRKILFADINSLKKIILNQG